MIAGVLLGTQAQAQSANQDQQGNPSASVQPATDASAQTATPDSTPATSPTAGNQSDIVVTGSRIVQPNLTSASPVTVINAQEIKLQGATRIEDVVNVLPQAFAQQSSSVSNGSTGTANANLRNLGAQRTLVLINGRRLMSGDPTTDSSADLNFIPAALIKRVDVLTGGASSVYGSDAVAGVVNFVLDTDYKGISVDSTYSVFNHDNRSERFQNISRRRGYPAPSGLTTDGQTFDVNLKVGAGTEDGRGHVVGYLGYRKIDAIRQGDRDYSSCGLNAGTAGGDYVCGGSGTAFPANFSLGDVVRGGPPTSYTLNAGGALVAGRTLYNANPLNYYQRPDTRYTGGFLAKYEISDAVKPYAEFGFMDDRTVAQIAPSGNFGNTQTLNCNNPLFSAAQLATFCRTSNLLNANGDTVGVGGGAPADFLNPDGTTYNRASVVVSRRNVEGGGRQADLRHTSYRLVAGVRGDIAPGVSYDVFGQYGTTTYNLIYRNEFSVTRTARALDVITGANGQPVCRSVVDGSDPNCVPLNIFGATSITPGALNYVQVPGFQNGDTKQKIVSGSVTFLGSEYGIKSPWSNDGIGLNIGGEYREESLRLEVDTAFSTGDLAGQGGPTLPLSGGYNVKEAFAEVQVPLVSERPFFHELSVNGGFRYSDYSTSGSVYSYKGEAVWAPVRDLRFRGGYNRAVRAPNIQELFVAQSVQIDGATDPCAGTTPTFTAAQCVRLGVPTSRYGLILDNPSTQYNGLIGGNPNLDPEKADTYTVGVILQPSFLPGFNATVDAFRIKVKDIIGQLGADTILNQCGQTGDQTLCGLIVRDRNGTLFQTPQGYVIDTNINAGTLVTQGIDAQIGYTLRTATAGTFGLSAAGTYVDKFTSDRGGAKFDCAGYFGAQCGSPQSKWRHNVRLTYTTPDGIGLSGRWRYFSRVKFENTSSDSDLASSFFANDARIGAQSYFDLALTARVADQFTFRIGSNNILDKRPPIVSQTAAPIGSFGNGNTYPGIYDANGRYIYAGVQLDF